MRNGFGKIIAKMCIDNDETLRDVSRRSGVSYMTICRSGTSVLPSAKTVDKICHAYGLSDKQRGEMMAFAKKNKKNKFTFNGIPAKKRTLLEELCGIAKDMPEAEIRRLIDCCR